MRILSIETSCDETAVSIVEAIGDFPTATYQILGDALFSQIEIHKEFGGVFPMMAKREHAKALVPMLEQALTEAELLENTPTEINDSQIEKITFVLERENGLADTLLEFLKAHELPEIDLIAVTSGPGLEPALWVGISFAKALAVILKCPVVPVNHMEGHILSALYNVVEDDALAPITFPAIALLISGGHTELVLMKDWAQYEKIGETRDDAVGEAFDKVARLMGLPYPGGPEIGRRASEARTAGLPPYKDKLPRPMISTDDYDFSFSGLKTAVRYAIDGKEMTEEEKNALSRDFEEAITEVLLKKTTKAIDNHSAKTLIIGGGVSANNHIRRTFETELLRTHPDVEIYLPHRNLSTDNSIMIALAGHAEMANGRTGGALTLLKADGNRSL
ncbi:tRNA (adenosine(37)-N6)-threonylcarbamoyltransferase complex transferase subunit TsaD [Candidatus Kaiserbacteria bacterium CG_4_8_14_3_um_filter_38_9]|uniref:tRNA N6-adenosine threonylcarbamoyltransferase n=1 Tax=Candidatus Kaiserbacteria bacterium CG_4_8_14_3_um_filter_38_9 TaxID=1974599 RepID=A0A2M7INZ5_9BACT|nr:MAG: tRNA (adenosine(37)-N6)-threonylcarbamoyltransferase complex transferase subunit TsaD [Candidatus Kaiserbacteria bacterium CG_4_8_14_3_um_filter_38_9]